MRRSAIHKSDALAPHRFHSPYRCNDCHERFWVVSRSSYYGAGMLAAAAAGVVVGWSLSIVGEGLRAEPEEAQRAAARVAAVARLAENNDPAAQRLLARIYTQGEAVAQNAAEGRKWLERSAQQGNVEAQYELGIALKEGRGVVQDYEGAVKWLQLAAEGGHAAAQYELGLVYRLGTGVSANNSKAYTWLNLAAAQGIAAAAAERDTVVKLLSPADVMEAQALARRLSESKYVNGGTAAKAEFVRSQ